MKLEVSTIRELTHIRSRPTAAYFGGGRTSGGGAASISAHNLVISQIDFSEAVTDFHVQNVTGNIGNVTAEVGNNLAHLVRSGADDCGNLAVGVLAVFQRVQTVNVIMLDGACVPARGRSEITNCVFDTNDFVLHFCTLTFFFRGVFTAPVVFTNSVFVGDIRVQLFKKRDLYKSRLHKTGKERTIVLNEAICMWLLYAVGSALFAGLTSILAKCGIRKTDSTVATAIRTIIVLIFAWVMVFVVGSQGTIASIPARSLVFLGLSGLATGASWLCYFYALQRGPIDKVVPIDKSSTVMTILLAALLLGESVTLTRGIGVVLIAAGTFLMIEKKGGVQKEENGWMLAAFGSAIFAALTSILGKVGITGVESNLGTALRTGVVLIMAWVMVFVQGKQGQMKAVPKNELGFICLSGLATGASWLCYYKALQLGPASLVAPIDKLSILVTVLFSYIVFHERLSRKALTGLAVLVAGTLVMLV